MFFGTSYLGVMLMYARKKNITIVDVAAKAGVSKTTISRYLNGKFEFMSSASRERIAAVIEELGYRPNNLARGLKSKHSKLLGVVIADITSPFSSILLKGISDCCERYGYGVLITNTGDDPKKEREYILSMIDQHVDGIILNTTGKNQEFLLQLAKDDVPLVLADRPLAVKAFDTVRTADREITFTALGHLRERGYTSVGLFMEPLENGTRVCRCNAYQDAYREIFGKMPQVYFIEKLEEAAVIPLLQEFQQDNAGESRAILTANGVATLQVVHGMKRLGLAFPDDIGICGFDNWEWTELVDDGITVIAQPSYKVGRECVKRLMMRLYRNSKALPRSIELPCELLVRNSTNRQVNR